MLCTWYTPSLWLCEVRSSHSLNCELSPSEMTPFRSWQSMKWEGGLHCEGCPFHSTMCRCFCSFLCSINPLSKLSPNVRKGLRSLRYYLLFQVKWDVVLLCDHIQMAYYLKVWWSGTSPGAWDLFFTSSMLVKNEKQQTPLWLTSFTSFYMMTPAPPGPPHPSPDWLIYNCGTCGTS